MEAIKESQIAIVVFSENYASSKWCLDELAEIMECKEQRNLVVFPVFYKVEPREVRTPGKGDRQSYGKAMAEHEVNFGKDSEKVKRWKKALSNVGSLSGWHVTENEYEAGLIQEIVRIISTQLDRTPLNVAKYPVGIDSRVQELQTILNLQSKDDILMVGLWGQGGIGKTTLAKAIYNAIFREFQGSCFLDRVNENSKSFTDLVHLQKKLLSQVLRKESIVFSVDEGSQLIQDRLSNKKVLIILDGVNDEDQLNALAGDCKWFGKGSRIIITTRNKRLLTSHGVYSDKLYKVTTLKCGEALELFRKHAFLRSQKIKIRSNLVNSVLHYAKGLPLALEVLGSFLCGKGEHHWESTLEKLAQSPKKKINDVLKVSYDGLKDDVKEIFLDIACFFKGQQTKYIREVLDCCDFKTTFGVHNLIELSLISEEDGTLQMHDLIKRMGMKIVKGECRDDAGKCSRLWLYDDVLDVLSGGVGTDAIKAIVLKLPKFEETYICPNAFTNMGQLRLLILHNVGNSFQGPIRLPSQLRCLELHSCALIPEFGYGRKRLVRLDMPNSKIKELPKFKDFIKLKFISFSECQSLVCIPDLNCTPNLEILDLYKCKNLESVHESVSYHNKLQLLNLGDCSKLHHLPDVLHSKNLQLLNLNGCSKLQRLPDFSDKMKRLQGLYLQSTLIEGLPASIENLVSLGEMDLDYCENLTILPSSIYRLPNLELLTLRGCSNLVKFPKMGVDSSDPHTKMGFPKLSFLDISGCILSEIEFLDNPSWFPSLNYFFLEGTDFTNLLACEQQYKSPHSPVLHCKRIQEILDIPRQFQRRWAIGCETLCERASNICDFDNVDLSSCHEWFRDNVMLKQEDFYSVQGCQQVVMRGGEMPEWLLPNNEGHISFVASKDLFEKFLGLAFCVVARTKCGEKETHLDIVATINGSSNFGASFTPLMDSDHVFLQCFEPRLLWSKVSIVPNDWNCFTLTLTTWGSLIVKTCGFRLICKPLEKNDLEIFLQHNQSLDPALLYEVRHEDHRTRMVEESSSETEDLLGNKISKEENSSSDLILEGSNVTDIPIQNYRYFQFDRVYRKYRNVVPGREMLKEFVPVEDGTISFMASQDLYDKFIGLALCVVFGVEDGKNEISFDIVPHINGEMRNVLSGTLGSFDSNHTWIQYLRPNVLWGLLEGEVDFAQFDEIYLRFSLDVRVLGGTLQKLGYMIRCGPLEDDLKAVLGDKITVNPASLYEEDSYESSFLSEDSFLRRINLIAPV
ncbi:TMV resistance protein N [Eucalyptus grandis]|uniref:TMV resistance protein N n=1 Tax=Eucalyptus grandis TaxID=71139 RepID=UPI00192EB6FD|nr:TMV resistance protein N [Eucalyptus grandis]